MLLRGGTRIFSLFKALVQAASIQAFLAHLELVKRRRWDERCQSLVTLNVLLQLREAGMRDDGKSVCEPEHPSCRAGPHEQFPYRQSFRD